MEKEVEGRGGGGTWREFTCMGDILKRRSTGDSSPHYNLNQPLGNPLAFW